jgi:membrane protein insertase Oxa1/YidC/SpoIIIJ
MKLYNKAGVNPGRLYTGLMQAPIFYALFLSFGNKFETKGFLWADDLSSTLFMSYHFMFVIW